MAGRNALTQPRSMQMAAPPAEQGPPQGMPQQQGGGGDPVMTLMQEAQRAGYQGNDPEEAAAMLWKMAPTDGVGEMIDEVARMTGIRTPWQQGPSGEMDHRGSMPSYGDTRRGSY